MEKMTEVEVVPLEAIGKNRYVREGAAKKVLVRTDTIVELWPVDAVILRERDMGGAWRDAGTMNVAMLCTVGRGDWPLFVTPESYEKLALAIQERPPRN